MTPEEKARELFEKMFQQRIAMAGSYTIFRDVAKNCALVAAEQGYEACWWHEKKPPPFSRYDKQWWEQVKQAIINL